MVNTRKVTKRTAFSSRSAARQIRAHLGLVLCGRVPAILSWPTTRVDAEKYQRNLLFQFQISTPCLFGGYWTRNGLRRDTVNREGWYATAITVSSRMENSTLLAECKDIIIVGGQNIFPEDLENMAGGVRGVYPRRGLAFGIDDEDMGTQSIALVAEMTGDFDANTARDVEREIRKLITATLAVAPRYVAVVPQRWIVKSAAGVDIKKRDAESFPARTVECFC